MRNYFLRAAENLNNAIRKRRLRKRIMSVLACEVVFCTAYSLILPAITMEAADNLIKPEVQPAVKDESLYSMQYEGADYKVTVSFSDKAGFPADVRLTVRELVSDSEEYKEHYKAATEALPDGSELLFCRFFDITFLSSDGEELEPKDSVDVQIAYKEAIKQDDSVTCNAVHFASDGIEVLPAKVDKSESGESAFMFTQDSFSTVGTAISAINLNSGEYIFYRDGYALGAYSGGVQALAVTVDENGYVYPTNPNTPIDLITWRYDSSTGALINKALENANYPCYFNLEETVNISSTPQRINARIINNAIRLSTEYKSIYQTINFHLGMDTTGSGIPTFKAGALFADGVYFLAAKVADVDDSEIKEGDLSITDGIKASGQLTPKLNSTALTGKSIKYTWYRRNDEKSDWVKVERKRVTGSAYNVAEDGSWLNVAYDGGADKEYKVVISEIDGAQPGKQIESAHYHVPYYDSIQNGSFKNPVISTDVSDPEHYQPLLPNGTAGMVWKTTAGDGVIEFISVDSWAFKDYSTRWHNCPEAASGVQYVELNAGMDGALYQDVLTVPGSTMYWRLAHRGRGRQGATGIDSEDTMYVLIMPTNLAENITTQNQVLEVMGNLSAYPGATVKAITTDNSRWVYHKGTYDVPNGQYLTRYFFVSGPTAYDKNPLQGELAYTIGNHLDDIHFSIDMPPPEKGKVNLEIVKTAVGTDENSARSLFDNIQFKVGSNTIYGTEFKNFTANDDKSFTATYQIQIDIGEEERITEIIQEVLSTADINGYNRIRTTVSVNDGALSNSNSTSITVYDQKTGKVTFTNTYEEKAVDISIAKVNEQNKVLSGAIFSLDVLKDGNWDSVNTEITVDNQGKAYITGLKKDTLYRLKEIVSPDGYSLLKDDIYFKIVSQNGADTIKPFDSGGNAAVTWLIK